MVVGGGGENMPGCAWRRYDYEWSWVVVVVNLFLIMGGGGWWQQNCGWLWVVAQFSRMMPILKRVLTYWGMFTLI